MTADKEGIVYSFRSGHLFYFCLAAGVAVIAALIITGIYFGNSHTNSSNTGDVVAQVKKAPSGAAGGHKDRPAQFPNATSSRVAVHSPANPDVPEDAQVLAYVDNLQTFQKAAAEFRASHPVYKSFERLYDDALLPLIVQGRASRRDFIAAGKIFERDKERELAHKKEATQILEPKIREVMRELKELSDSGVIIFDSGRTNQLNQMVTNSSFAESASTSVGSQTGGQNDSLLLDMELGSQARFLSDVLYIYGTTLPPHLQEQQNDLQRTYDHLMGDSSVVLNKLPPTPEDTYQAELRGMRDDANSQVTEIDNEANLLHYAG